MGSLHRSRGLSLLEMLVVLSLVSMVTSILFQGYGYMLSNYQRIQLRQSTGIQVSLANSWFRGSLENLVAYREPEQRFTATAAVISTTTFTPLLSRAGIPTVIRWELLATDEGPQLVYSEKGRTFSIHSWPEGTSAAFRFRSRTDGWQESWNVTEPQHIPSAIVLQLQSAEGQLIPPVTAVVQTRKQEQLTLEELFYGRGV
jgi:general secretion pathway protein J